MTSSATTAVRAQQKDRIKMVFARQGAIEGSGWLVVTLFAPFAMAGLAYENQVLGGQMV